MEYVFINYITGRLVRVDGKDWGITNSALMVEKGNHTFDLGEPKDYQPDSVQRIVKDTTSISPLIINDFHP